MCDAAHAHSSPRTHEKLARSKREELTFTAHARPRARLKRLYSSPNAGPREGVHGPRAKRIRGLQIAVESVFYVLFSPVFNISSIATYPTSRVPPVRLAPRPRGAAGAQPGPSVRSALTFSLQARVAVAHIDVGACPRLAEWWHAVEDATNCSWSANPRRHLAGRGSLHKP